MRYCSRVGSHLSPGIHHVFVYGTLRPGDVRWHYLEPFVGDDGIDDSVTGALYDTGHDYPAAVFNFGNTIRGNTFRIDEAMLNECLAVLDVEEDTVGGLYRRVVVRTDAGIDAWAYEYGNGLDLVLIPSGNWFEHRPPTPDC